ncbi:MAG: methionyl-tRNA formyltransferase [Tunicatimonas sp.]
MNDNPLRVIFMGTPEFAVASLQALVEQNISVVAVITAPDKPQGRGRKLGHSPVKEYALAQDLPVLQPPNLKSADFLEELRGYRADLQIVVAFRMLPEIVWDMPPRGTFNLHASLLPQYRGAAPINWAIINGETETGVTTFKIQHAIDTGNILFQEREPIHPDDTAGTLYERLMHRGADLVVRSVRAIASGDYSLAPQPEADDLKEAPKLHRETCRVDWEQPAETIHNFVRGLSPYPAAWTTLNGRQAKLFSVSAIGQANSTLEPGQHTTDNKTYLHIKALDSLVAVHDLQLEGKRRLSIEEFLRGNSL